MSNQQTAPPRLQVTINPQIDAHLTEILATGLFGNKKSELARYMIQEWIRNEWVDKELKKKFEEQSK